MQLTNKYNLPEAVVTAIQDDNYSRGSSDITVTQLIAPPRLVALSNRHKNEIVEDAADRFYMLFGKLIHELLEKADPNALVERLYMDVNGWRLGGLTDHIQVNEGDDSWIIKDYKCTSYYTINPDFNNGNLYKEEWEQQLNIYAQLFRANGFDVSSLSIVAIFRDFSKFKSQQTSYLKAPIQEISIPLWSEEKCMAFIKKRIIMHQMSEHLESAELPACTDKERWAKPTKYAVKVPYKDRAMILKNTAEDASTFIENNGDGSWWVEQRVGKSVRCDDYCNVNNFCSQYLVSKGI